MLQCIAMFQCCRGVTCSNGVWWIIQANKPHLLHVTWVVGALGVLWWDWDGQRSTSPTSTRPRGTTRQAAWTLRPRQSRVTHWAGTQARGRHRLIDTFVKKTQTIIASSEDASVNLDHLSQFYLLHCLTREQHRPVSWKAPVQLVAWTLQKKIISFPKDIFLQMFRWTLQLGYQRDRRSWKRTKTLNSLSPAILDYHYANV